jgi:hypothetical protein
MERQKTPETMGMLQRGRPPLKALNALAGPHCIGPALFIRQNADHSSTIE